MKTIGRCICERRKELGMTQEELAKRMGYKSKSTINKIELGINDVPQSKIVRFAEVLQTTPGKIMGWEGSETEKEPTVLDDGLSDNVRKLIEFAKSVPEDKAEMVLRVIQSIVESD